MTWKRTLYIVLVMAVAGVSALTGAVAGGAVVYQIAQKQSANPLNPLHEPLPTNHTNPKQTLVLNTTDVETAITQSVQKVSPTVVTVVGVFPGQNTFFGPTGDQTVGGSGFFITDQGYLLTNNHVVE